MASSFSLLSNTNQGFKHGGSIILCVSETVIISLGFYPCLYQLFMNSTIYVKIWNRAGLHPPSTKLSVWSAVICSTLTEESVGFSGECIPHLILAPIIHVTLVEGSHTYHLHQTSLLGSILLKYLFSSQWRLEYLPRALVSPISFNNTSHWITFLTGIGDLQQATMVLLTPSSSVEPVCY